MDNLSGYEYSLEIYKRKTYHGPVNAPTNGQSGPSLIDFVPLVIFAGLIFIVLIIYTGFKISKMLEKPMELDPPPSYAGLDIVVSAPIGPDFVHVSIAPPTYEVAVEGDQPPPYTFVNAAFEPDPPAYTTVNIQTTVNTHQTTVFNT